VILANGEEGGKIWFLAKMALQNQKVHLAGRRESKTLPATAKKSALAQVRQLEFRVCLFS